MYKESVKGLDQLIETIEDNPIECFILAGIGAWSAWFFGENTKKSKRNIETFEAQLQRAEDVLNY